MEKRRRRETLNPKTGQWEDTSTIIPASEQKTDVDIRADNTLRRAGAGRRSLMDYFSEEDKRKEVRRSELLGILEAVEGARYANVWYRRLWRWLNRVPGPQDLPRAMARKHFARTIGPMTAAVKKELDRQAAAANAEASEGCAGADR